MQCSRTGAITGEWSRVMHSNAPYNTQMADDVTMGPSKVIVTIV